LAASRADQELSKKRVDLDRPRASSALPESLADHYWATGKCVYEKVAPFTDPKLKRHCRYPYISITA
jgi:hypothetical protein